MAEVPLMSWTLILDWGNVRVILGSYGDTEKENGNYYNGVYRVLGLFNTGL